MIPKTPKMISLPVKMGWRLPMMNSAKATLACSIAVLGLVDLVWAHYINLNFSGLSLTAGVVALLALIGLFYDRSGRSKRLSEMGYYAALWIAFSTAGIIFSYLTASLNFPLKDAFFASLDESMGFNWVALYLLIEKYPRLSGILGWAYDSMCVQLFVSMLYFAHKQWTRKNEELLGIAFISLVITSILSGIFPAVCAWHYFDLGVERSVHLTHLLSLRDGTATEFLIDQVQGIVTLPSYHTVIALLLIYIYRDQKWSFMFILMLNSLMLLSVPSIGGHYLVDMIAAGVVFALSVAVTRSVLRYLDHAKALDDTRSQSLIAQGLINMSRMRT